MYGVDGLPLYDPPGMDPAELAALRAGVAARHAAVQAAADALETARTALTDALALAPLYPAPTPEETLVIDTQVNAALAGFRALTDPPADVVALAAAVVSWRASL